MRLKLGRLRLKSQPAYGSDTLLFNLQTQPAYMGLRYHQHYRWRCADTGGGNPPKPRTIRIGPLLVTRRFTPLGGVHLGATARQERYLLRASGARNVADLGRMLLALLPARDVPFDLDRQRPPIPFDARHNLRVVYAMHYRWFFLYPTPNPSRAQYLLGLPNFAGVDYIIDGFCGPRLPKPVGVPVFVDSAIYPFNDVGDALFSEQYRSNIAWIRRNPFYSQVYANRFRRAVDAGRTP